MESDNMGKSVASTLRLELSPDEHVFLGKPKSCADAKLTWTKKTKAEKTSTVRLKIGVDGNIIGICEIKDSKVSNEVKPAIPIGELDGR